MAKTRYRGITWNPQARMFRVAMSISGQMRQVYRPTIEAARQVQLELQIERAKTKPQGPGYHSKKRAGTMDPELPPGYHLNQYWELTVRSGWVLRQRIVTRITRRNVHLVSFSASFGTHRTKAEALAIAQEKRSEFLKQHALDPDDG